MASIYASKLPHYVKDWDLRNYFQKFGRVVSVRVNPGRSGLKSAFVNFADATSVERALQNQHPVFLGRRISVSLNTGGEFKTENPYTYSGGSVPAPAPPSTRPTTATISSVSTSSIPSAAPIKVKTEPGLEPISFTVKQEPVVLRPGDGSSFDPSSTHHWATSRPETNYHSNDPYQSTEFSVSAPPVAKPSRASNDPFQGSSFLVSSNPFKGSTDPHSAGPQVQTVYTSPLKSEKAGKHDEKYMSTKSSKVKKSFSLSGKDVASRESLKRRFSDVEFDKAKKKKVMSVGNLKLPRSAAEFVEANRKFFEDKRSSPDDSAEESLPAEILEEKKRIVKVLNTGSSEKLQRLQLIGKKKADAIIAYRRLRGKFRKVEDLSKISLFGDQFMQKFKEANFIG